ncbi:histone deacetylase 6-like [Daktulosphaira vitifoliae]|uniref:histone deacetylase 6-like n=1 Tax=Daktulosphaira vitifoliae TaxID=58002 RepID=UPI0021A98D19|nr:histone deacetylase 6-like [Daktulosphaira vitifoliae]
MTGIVYDDKFVEHRCLWDDNYSENPSRYTSIIDRCKSLGLLDRCIKINTREAKREEILSKHSAEHVDLLKQTENLNEEQLERLSANYDSIYLHPFTYKQSLMAAGSSIDLTKSVVEGNIQNGMAIIRPPGHHAMKSEYCGYCFFNNAAIAAQHALDSKSVNKVLIVDWDIHHGQATQQMFYNDPRVLYFSIHRYEYGQFWPNLRESDSDYIGTRSGKGYNINVPLNQTGMQNEDYMAIVHYLLIPIAYEFSPDLIIVSCGYDSAIGDPKGEMCVTPVCYAHIISKLMGLAQGKIVGLLEGGYFNKSLAESAALTLRALLKDPNPMLAFEKNPSECVMKSIHNVMYAHKNYWKCLEKIPLANNFKPNWLYTYNNKDKPTIFPTRNMYPQNVNDIFDTTLTKIITETELTNPTIRLGLSIQYMHNSTAATIKNNMYQHIMAKFPNIQIIETKEAHSEEQFFVKKYFSRIFEPNTSNKLSENDLKILENDFYTIRCLLRIINLLHRNEVKSAIYIPIFGSASLYKKINSNIMYHITSIGAIYAHKICNIKRIMIVEWNGNQLEGIDHKNKTIFPIIIHKALNFDNSNSYINKSQIKIAWPKENMNEMELIALMHYVILPFAYDQNPQLIIMTLNLSSDEKKYKINITPDMYSHLVHWFSLLANGHLILMEHNDKLNSKFRNMCIAECTKAMLNYPLNMINSKKSINAELVEIIKSTIRIY